MRKDLQLENKKLDQQLKYWQIEKQLILRKQDLKEDKKKIKNRYNEQRKKLSTSKFLMLCLDLITS